MSAHLRAEAVLRVFERGPFLVPSAVEGAREGSAGDKFRVSGTKEMVEGAGANKESGGRCAPLKMRPVRQEAAFGTARL